MQSDNSSPSIWEKLEEGLGSRGRIRVLRMMTESPNRFYTKYAIAKKTKLNPADVTLILASLERLGWIKRYSGAPVKYQINLEDSLALQISRFFQEIASE